MVQTYSASQDVLVMNLNWGNFCTDKETIDREHDTADEIHAVEKKERAAGAAFEAEAVAAHISQLAAT
uniref:Uncharacterized protein n=1 Tax=Hyaloperonospora arabidopsidis (strain Emoy2) TaxID=559515 RepID=M4B2N1_HYAAE